MKTILLLSFLFTFVLCANGQALTTPPKRANTILIQTSDSAATAFITLGKTLAAQGFAIATSNQQFGTISTESKPLKGGVSYRIIASIIQNDAGSSIRITSTMNDITMNVLVPGIGQTQVPVYYGGMKGSPLRLAWEGFDTVAKAYPNGTVTYAKMP